MLSYTTLPFLNPKSVDGHTNRWECVEIARIFIKHNYSVDIIDHTNKSFIPKKNYKYCIDAQDNIERLSPFLGKNCLKIFHITTAHWLFNNTAEYRRLLDIKERRGVALAPRRTLPPSRNIELADAVAILGNNFTAGTYAYAKKTMYRIPISTTHLYPSPENKNFESARNGFIWIGGAGMAHKGLDLTLEAFSEMPKCNLTIFGKKDEDFEEAYKKELCQTPNIHYIGHTDLGSRKFKDIIENSIAIVFPSCSEGCSGGVVTAMHAGLIPIISLESGVDVNNFGIILKENTINEIKKQVQYLASLPSEELKNKAIKAWEYARNNHTRERFSKEYQKIINKILFIKIESS
ncbi:MAG: glycosyltransferase [bacterium]|nr:glycosyltransferase [bacterium]